MSVLPVPTMPHPPIPHRPLPPSLLVLVGGGASSDQSVKGPWVLPRSLGPATPSAAPSSPRKWSDKEALGPISSHSSAPTSFPLIPTRLIRRSHRFFPQILQECPGASPGPSCRCIVRSPHRSSAAVHPPPPSPGDSPTIFVCRM